MSVPPVPPTTLASILDSVHSIYQMSSFPPTTLASVLVSVPPVPPTTLASVLDSVLYFILCLIMSVPPGRWLVLSEEIRTLNKSN